MQSLALFSSCTNCLPCSEAHTFTEKSDAAVNSNDTAARPSTTANIDRVPSARVRRAGRVIKRRSVIILERRRGCHSYGIITVRSVFERRRCGLRLAIIMVKKKCILYVHVCSSYMWRVLERV